MKAEETYRNWKEQKRKITVGPGFSEMVMDRIYRYEHEKRTRSFNAQRVVELVSAHPLAIAGTIAVGVVIGLIRVACAVMSILGHCSECG
jgi:hypothetical protein